MRRMYALVSALVLAALLMPAAALASSGQSARGVDPGPYPGNFVASDDEQVCYEIANLLDWDVTEEMHGFKIDPPANFENNFVKVTLSADGKYLDWEAKNGATVVAVIIKGGNNFHLYDYLTAGFGDNDQGLHSPLKGRNIPQISHYNICYIPQAGGTNGCTPGYWRNHADRWEGAAPGDDFDATFGVDLFSPNITLGQAIQLGGGGANALARHATAALLNSFGGVPNGDGTTVDYPYTTAEVIAMVQAAVANGTIESTKDTLADANQLGCPLSGTRAQKV